MAKLELRIPQTRKNESIKKIIIMIISANAESEEVIMKKLLSMNIARQAIQDAINELVTARVIDRVEDVRVLNGASVERV